MESCWKICFINISCVIANNTYNVNQEVLYFNQRIHKHSNKGNMGHNNAQGVLSRILSKYNLESYCTVVRKPQVFFTKSMQKHVLLIYLFFIYRLFII